MVDIMVLFGEMLVTPDNSKLIMLWHIQGGQYRITNPLLTVFDINDILQAEEGSTIEPIQIYKPRTYGVTYSSRAGINLSLNNSGTLIRMSFTGEERNTDETFNYVMKSGTTDSNGNKLIGLNYQGEYFYNANYIHKSQL